MPVWEAKTVSAEDIQAIIRRSIIDRAFAKALRKNFPKAVEEYHLTSIELAALKAMQIEYEGLRKKRSTAKRSPRRRLVKVVSYYRLD